MIPNAAKILLCIGILSSVAECSLLDVYYVDDLPATKNMSLIHDIKEILDSYRYTEKYEAGKFDCMESCSITFDVLQKRGYQPRIIMRPVRKDAPGEAHVWLAVPDGEGRYAFIETTIWAFQSAGLGGVVLAEDVSSMKYDCGIMIESPDELAECFGLTERVASHRASYEPVD